MSERIRFCFEKLKNEQCSTCERLLRFVASVMSIIHGGWLQCYAFHIAIFHLTFLSSDDDFFRVFFWWSEREKESERGR